VKFLIRTFGIETFRKCFSALKDGDDPEINRQRLESITGKSLVELESLWD
jgi:hypothetical protein